MKVPRTLGVRLLSSHLAVVAASSLTVLVVGLLVAPAFYHGHLSAMSHMMSSENATSFESVLESGFRSAFLRALSVSILIGVGVAVLLSVIGARRVVKPINDIRTAARRLASGDYRDRIEEPFEDELAALVEDFNRMAAALRETEDRRLRLLGDLSHELRTPLTTIEGYMEAILDGVLNPTPEIVGAAAREAARLKRLAADIGLLSNAEEARLTLNLESVELGRLAAGVVQRLAPQFVEAEVTVSVESPRPTLVTADPDRVIQIVTNLIGNALTYTPLGGEVTVSVERSGDHGLVHVVDTGRGIAAEDTERIFERFYRGDRSAPGGMGVGLSIARSLARLQAGDISVTSGGIGLGSRFILKLPIVP